jgi:hypothetical protein
VPWYEHGLPMGWEFLRKEAPPIFESEAAYLKRFGLFMPGEERRLPADAFEPVALDVTEDKDSHWPHVQARKALPWWEWMETLRPKFVGSIGREYEIAQPPAARCERR